MYVVEITIALKRIIYYFNQIRQMDILFFTLAISGVCLLLVLCKYCLWPNECSTRQERFEREQQQQQRAGRRVQTVSQQIVQVDPSKGNLFVIISM